MLAFGAQGWEKRGVDEPTNEAMVKGENTLEAGTPASFDVLINEIKGLALDMDLVPTQDQDKGLGVVFADDNQDF